MGLLRRRCARPLIPLPKDGRAVCQFLAKDVCTVTKHGLLRLAPFRALYQAATYLCCVSPDLTLLVFAPRSARCA